MKLNTVSLAEVELGFPVFAEGPVHALIQSAKVEPNKANDGNLLKCECLLTEPILYTKDGKELQNKGRFKMTYRISLKPTDNYDPNKRLKELSLAIGNQSTDDLELDQLAGKKVIAMMTIKAAEGQYKEQSEIARLTKRSDEDLFEDPPF